MGIVIVGQCILALSICNDSSVNKFDSPQFSVRCLFWLSIFLERKVTDSGGATTIRGGTEPEGVPKSCSVFGSEGLI